MRQEHIVIVGGGITGLSAAYQLMRRSPSALRDRILCTVLESSPQLGGKIKTHREGGFVLEGGPDSLLARKPEGIGLIRELGLEAEVVGGNPAVHKTYILKRGKLEPMPPGTNMGIPTSLAPFVTTRLISLKGKLRALLDVLITRQSHKKDVSLGQFLRRRLGDDLIDSLVEPLLAGIYAGSVDELSLEATFPQFRALEDKHRSLILGSMAQRTKAISPLAKSGRSAFITLQCGLQTLIERLYDELHEYANIETNSAVVRIERRADQRFNVTYLKNSEECTLTADSVILTTPSYVSKKLLTELSDRSVQALEEIKHVSTATVILGYEATSLDIELDASGFLVPRREGKTITACTWVSSKWPHTTPKRFVVVRCYVGRANQEEALSLSDDKMVEAVQRDLESILQIDAKPVFSRVTRWNEAMPQYRVGHRDRLNDLTNDLSQTYPGLFICGASYDGVGVPDCIGQGYNAAKKALRHLNLVEIGEQ